MKNYKPDWFSPMYSNKIIIVILSVIFLTACVATLYIPNEEDAKSNNIPLRDLQKGRELYINNCSSCHNLHLPSEFTKKEWWKAMDNMQKRAKIDSSQKSLITNYLMLNAKK